MGKKLWLSKTFWVNLIAIVALAIQSIFGFVIEPTHQIWILGVINAVLRMVTKEPIAWNDKTILERKGVVRRKV